MKKKVKGFLGEIKMSRRLLPTAHFTLIFNAKVSLMSLLNLLAIVFVLPLYHLP